MEIYKKPIIYSHSSIKGIVPVAVAAAATSATEVAAGVAAVVGFLTGLGSDDFYPEHSRALTERKNF